MTALFPHVVSGALLLLVAGTAPSQPLYAGPVREGAAPAIRLEAPFDTVRQRERWGRVMPQLAACPPVPAPVRDHLHEPFYTDRNNSVADPAKRGKVLQSLAPMWAYSKGLNDLAEDFVRATPADLGRARCVLAWLDAWASAGALTGKVDKWGFYDTLWADQIAAGMAYFKIWRQPGLDAAAKARVAQWLAILARRAVNENEGFNEARRKRKEPPHNLSFWTAAGAVVAGVAADDRPLFDWGIRTAREGLGAVTAAGALPAELERKGRAFVYHTWALEPLMLVAAFAAANGVDLIEGRQGALARIVDFLIEARADPAAFEALAGAPQQGDSRPAAWPTSKSAAALEVYLSLRPDPRIEVLVAPLRPVTSQFSGGNFSLMFARPAPGH